jgi:hypothetical protein
VSDDAAAGGDREPSEEAAVEATARDGALVPPSREPPSEELAGRALEPAPLELEELERRPAYMPRFPWRWILAFAALATLIVGGYQLRQRMRADALRSQILESHDRNLRPLAERYVAFRERLERWVIGAAQAGEPEPWVDPRLRISGLHSGEGLYLRLLASEAGDPAAIASGARLMGADALTRCLGIAPASARGLFEQGGFLTRSWVDEVRSTSDFMRLRVLDEQLARSSEVDVPVIASLLRAEYFLLVLQQGASRRDSPVDVYLWDLRQERQLLRTRIRANGILLPVRLRFEGAPAGAAAPPPPLFSAGAHDCSIAAQIKAMTGEPAMEVGSGAELEAQAATLEGSAAPSPGPAAPPADPTAATAAPE